MKIFTAAQIREWDKYTIQHEPIAAIDLMERAAAKCFEWLLDNYAGNNSYSIICGNGNNGGDGLAVARMLAEKNIAAKVFICTAAPGSSADFETNLARLTQQQLVPISFIKEEKELPVLGKNEIIIEALFGAGLSRPPQDIAAMLISYINKSGCGIISIDVPAGMYADVSSRGNTIITATHTLSFQCHKLAFMLPENERFTGAVHLLDIGLHPAFYKLIISKYLLTDKATIRLLYKPRNAFAHKGNFGHALLLAGSFGKMGAAVLSARACLRSGAGLLTCHVPGCGYTIMQVSIPEAMLVTDVHEKILTKTEEGFSKYNAIGIGPGIGIDKETIRLLRVIFGEHKKPMVIDADALNGIAMEKSLLDKIHTGSVLTPHPKEFERLFGKSENDFERIEKALHYAKQYNIVIVLKGHHSFIATAGGYGYFNSTGNAGMATAGSGDVLTGIITGLMAQGYDAEQAAVLGVYLHGLAGDIAAEKLSQEAMLAGDIVENIGGAYKNLFI